MPSAWPRVRPPATAARPNFTANWGGDLQVGVHASGPMRAKATRPGARGRRPRMPNRGKQRRYQPRGSRSRARTSSSSMSLPLRRLSQMIRRPCAAMTAGYPSAICKPDAFSERLRGSKNKRASWPENRCTALGPRLESIPGVDRHWKADAPSERLRGSTVRGPHPEGLNRLLVQRESTPIQWCRTRVRRSFSHGCRGPDRDGG